MAKGPSERPGHNPIRPRVVAATAAGGALGAPARYGVSKIIHVAPNAFPIATFVINLTGAFVLGAFITIVIERFPPNEYARPFVAIGFLGAYTTYSTLAVESATLVKNSHAALGIGYAVISVAAGLIVAYLGIIAGRLVPPRSRRQAE